MKGRIFRIQRFSIHDGYGIRTTVFLKGCPLRCIWCHNPESQKFDIEVGYKIEKCNLCFRCGGICEAIGHADGVEIDRGRCDGCGRCVEICSAGAFELYGLDVGVEDVMNLIEKDAVFYKNSGGGVTFSGGEPYFQPDFLLALLKACKNMGINTAVDTSGYAKWSTIERTLPFVDFFLYDLKDYRDDRHRKFCGAGNEPIISNLKKLIDAGKEVIVRIPVVPGYNFENGDFEGYFKVLENTGCERVDVLPFHSLAVDKYRWLGRDWDFPDITRRAREMSEEFARFLEKRGMQTSIGGYF
ncbi:glycyl-radical enzyme activating protein [Archaeoglobus neptunius]|uniref:glycyl-radical enzyme activating protein n=1 Tax=Archaeoglobus neptunius TaxID=2798580 RepID=UPI001E54A7FD|nr:glycyl-radical enzyme activating protein [Archaeoglobus neptunius]